MMMSDGSLSQAEIDALLESSNETTISEASEAPEAPVATAPGSPLSAVADSPEPIGDAFSSALNAPAADFDANADTADTAAANADAAANTAAISDIARQALEAEEKILKELINTKCSLKLIDSKPLDLDALRDELGPAAIQIKRSFSGEGGKILHLLSEEDAIKFASHTIGQNDLQINDLVLNALQEIFSQFQEPLLQQIGDYRGAPVEVNATLAEQLDAEAIAMPAATPVLNTYQLSIKREKIHFYEILDATAIVAPNAPAAEAIAPVASPPANPGLAPRLAPAPNPAPNPAPPMPPSGAIGRNISPQPQPSEVKPVMLHDFGDKQSSVYQGNIELLMDVEMRLSVELGQTRKSVREILQLGEGSIIELDKLAGEPIDVKVNQQLIAKGEVVVIDENFGVRITEIISPADRIRHLG